MPDCKSRRQKGRGPREPASALDPWFHAPTSGLRKTRRRALVGLRLCLASP